MTCPSSLQNILWHKVRIALRNQHNRYQKQHPLFIFQAICNHAAGKAELRDENLFFHPLTHLPARVHKGMVYELEIVFPHENPEHVERFLDALDEHLQTPDSNFSMEGHSEVQSRDIAQLSTEFGSPPAEEICLEFLTPCPFDCKNSKRNWLLDPGHLIRLMLNRLNRFYKLELSPEDFPCNEVNLLPYYWKFEQHSHQAKSNKGRQYAAGMTGPLYIRGNIDTIWPLLLACSELHCGRRAANGQGYYHLVAERPFFDESISRFDLFQKTLDEIEHNSDIASEIAETVLDKPDFIVGLHQGISQGNTPGKPASGFYVDKRRGDGKRLIATLAPEDYLVHKYLHHLLSPVVDRMFEESSFGFRAGRSREEAARMIRQMHNEGFGHVLESDVASFFDEIDWDILSAKINAHLPYADCFTRNLLTKVASTPLEVHGKSVTRTKGLLQGSPLSPLLANLYLDEFDEEMERLGFRLVRYADDFIILTRGKEEADEALAAVRNSLARLKLSLKEEKSRVGSVDLGFSFLGISFGPGMDEEYVSGASIAKTLFITNRFVFAGIDYDSVIIRKDKQLVARFPIRQINEIVILGNNTLSTRLLHRCSKENIPVSFCSPTGYYYTTLRPDSKKHFELSASHCQRHAALDEPDKVSIARRIVIAKIHNYLDWFKEGWNQELGEGHIRQNVESFIAAISKTESIDSIRGYEGAAAKEIFRFINDQLVSSFFKCAGRRKRERKDPWNSLLDFSYSLLFTRINVLLRGRGLSPFLGILHSHKDNYESLVCDLQEPFRCRMDRFAARLVNLKVITEDSFEHDEHGRFWLRSAAIGIFLERFEREMETRLGRDSGTLKQLLIAQVHALQEWAMGDERLRIYKVGRD